MSFENSISRYTKDLACAFYNTDLHALPEDGCRNVSLPRTVPDFVPDDMRDAMASMASEGYILRSQESYRKELIKSLQLSRGIDIIMRCWKFVTVEDIAVLTSALGSLLLCIAVEFTLAKICAREVVRTGYLSSLFRSILGISKISRIVRSNSDGASA